VVPAGLRREGGQVVFGRMEQPVPSWAPYEEPGGLLAALLRGRRPALEDPHDGRTGFGEEIEIRQGTEIGRPSVLYARADGSAGHIERVAVGGSAVVVARGECRLG
jgi:hypothetical protein